ncbi:MAG: IgGFc-binding protein, partial [Bacteroidales bacterium]|jgi:hypothetical protein|nr:IgGFc-binding protein [Bacteroidales bacterium]
VGYTNTVKVYTIGALESAEGLELTANIGKDFYLTFGQNYNRTTAAQIGSDVVLQLKIVNPGNNAASVQLAFKNNTSVNQTVNVAANSLSTVTLTTAQKTAVYNVNTGVTNMSMRITSNNYIIVYAISAVSASTDATDVLPVRVLGTDYYQIGYSTTTNTYSGVELDGYMVVATEDATHVYLNSLAGTLQATLNTGQVYRYKTAAISDNITGRHIVTDKPVAFFSTTQIGSIPQPDGDHFFEQMFPVADWGMNFIAPQTVQGKVRIRVVASQNGTNITGSGFTLVTSGVVGGYTSLTGLNAGQFVELDCANAAGCYIAANHPVGVCSYLVGSGYHGKGVAIGGPSIAWLPPIEQTVQSSTLSRFAPGSPSQLATHYALLVTATSNKAATTVSVNNGTPALISGVTWYDNAASGLSFGSYTLPNDNVYRFANTSGMVVGGYGVGSTESYYYMASARARNLVATLNVNSIPYDEMQGRIYYRYNGVDPLVTFRCDYNVAPSAISWTLDNVAQPAQNNQSLWQAACAPGDHKVTMTVTIGTESFTQSAWFKIRDFVP